MLRSILIRQIFVVVDLSLALLVAATAGLVIYSLITPPSVEATVNIPTIPPALPSPVGAVQARADYDGLITSGLFPNEVAPPEPEPAPQPVDTAVEETQLNLRLIGTTDTADAKFASAIIVEGDQAGPGGVFAIGDDIIDEVVLKDVMHREVLIENGTVTPAKLEKLSMDSEEGEVAQGPPSAMAPAEPAQPVAGVQRITLNREELMADITANYAEIASKVRPELARDEQGNVIGVTANNISAVPLARKLGLGDGDVLQTVNNENIDSEQKIFEMIQKYQNASSIRIGVMSNGQPKVITYRLN